MFAFSYSKQNNMADKKNILITGSNGQLGNEIRRNSKKVEDLFNFIFTDIKELDITSSANVDSFVKENNIHYIINCAAYTAVDKAEDEDQIDLCYLINYEALKNLGNAAHKHGAKVIHVSTDYVFDGTKTSPYVETDATSANSVYGKSKVKGELALLNACPQSIIIRTAWLYSIYGNNFVKTMMKLGAERDSLNVVADQTGTPTNARDLAIAILNIAAYSESDKFEAGIYHYSNEGITTWYDFTIAIHQATDITTCKVSPITTEQYPTKAKRPKYSVLDKSKIKNTFSISIPKWEDSLNECVKELLAQQ